MKNTPINYEIVKQKIEESKLPNVGRSSIREIKRLIDNIESATGDRFIRMEMGGCRDYHPPRLAPRQKLQPCGQG